MWGDVFPTFGDLGGDMVGGNQIDDVMAPLNQIQLSCPVDRQAVIVEAELAVDAAGMERTSFIQLFWCGDRQRILQDTWISTPCPSR